MSPGTDQTICDDQTVAEGDDPTPLDYDQTDDGGDDYIPSGEDGADDQTPLSEDEDRDPDNDQTSSGEDGAEDQTSRGEDLTGMVDLDVPSNRHEMMMAQHKDQALKEMFQLARDDADSGFRVDRELLVKRTTSDLGICWWCQ